MHAKQFSKDMTVRVRCTFNPYVRSWHAKVVALPEHGVVIVQRISVIDGRNIDEPREVFTRDCDEPYGSPSWERDQEQAEAKYLALRQRVIDALRAKGIPIYVTVHDPDIEFRSDAFEGLAALLGLDQPAPVPAAQEEREYGDECAGGPP